MTKQEIKEEYKRTEGDPAIKGKVRQRQRELARSRMVEAVPKADLVLTNPTHYAVALKYDPTEMAAPIVIAKGQRLMAQKIKEIAAANGIPIVENPPVTRMIYKMVEVGQADSRGALPDGGRDSGIRLQAERTSRSPWSRPPFEYRLDELSAEAVSSHRLRRRDREVNQWQ